VIGPLTIFVPSKPLIDIAAKRLIDFLLLAGICKDGENPFKAHPK